MDMTDSSLPGFRDFYPQECARRNYILEGWKRVARRYGFVEYDGPTLEATDLYRRKSGDEIVGQLFQFQDKGEREVALRPEMTPTLARMVVAREREFKKPIKWFCAPTFFRYEKQQKGRLREFIQFNADLIGDDSAAADAEIISLVIDSLLEFGLKPEDFLVRISNRKAWQEFFEQNNLPLENLQEFLQIVDKIERVPEETTTQKLEASGTSLAAVRNFIQTAQTSSRIVGALTDDLDARGFAGYYEVDLTIVRGLAYYTGTVFEVFDRSLENRAIAGGGRYDDLLEKFSDGKVNLPAIGVGIGDVVLGNLLDSLDHTRTKMEEAIAKNRNLDGYLMINDESQRPEMIRLATQLRRQGYRMDFALRPMKLNKQFQAAENAGAQLALILQKDAQNISVKILATREEKMVAREDLETVLKSLRAV